MGTTWPLGRCFVNAVSLLNGTLSTWCQIYILQPEHFDFLYLMRTTEVRPPSSSRTCSHARSRTSGNQFKNAPLVGQAMRDLVDACEAGHDHDGDPVTTDCHHIGRTLDLGAFSRLRTGVATSGTVLG